MNWCRRHWDIMTSLPPVAMSTPDLPDGLTSATNSKEEPYLDYDKTAFGRAIASKLAGQGIHKIVILVDAAPLLALIDAGQGEAHRRSVEAYAKIASPLLTTWCCFTSCNVLSLPVKRLASAENPLAVHAAKSAISASY